MAEQTPRSADLRTTLFIRMWAVAHVVHVLVSNHYALDTPWNVGVVATAFLVALRPDAVRPLVAMLVLQVADYVHEAPLSPDHWTLVAFVNTALMISLALNRFASVRAVGAALPAARALLLIAYSAAAVSKYNLSFVDPVTSCANAIAGTVSYGLVPTLSGSTVIPYAVVATESLVALLLVVPTTRSAGVLLGTAFHFTLSATPAFVVTDFTSVAYALFFLFLPTTSVERIAGTVSRWSSRSAIVRDARRRPRLTAVLAFVALGFGGHISFAVVAAVGFVIVQIYIVTLLLATWTNVRPGQGGATFGRPRLAHVAVLLLALVWALSPYLGLRTTSVFTMFSNIRTEAPSSNHLFMPSVHLTDWQDDMVILRSSNDAGLQSGADKSLAVPLVALRRYAMDDPGLEVTGVLHGRTVEFGPEEGQTALEALPYWQYKYLLMRPVVSNATSFCSVS